MDRYKDDFFASFVFKHGSYGNDELLVEESAKEFQKLSALAIISLIGLSL